MSKQDSPKFIRAIQYYWRRYVQLPYWTIRCGWGLVTGRFFFIRNAPNWFVRWLSSAECYTRSMVHKPSEDVQKLFYEAANERQLRLQVKLRHGRH
jgi:hypothetical protein